MEWECQGVLGAELGLGKRQNFGDGEMREGIVLGVGPGLQEFLVHYRISYSDVPVHPCTSQLSLGPGSKGRLWGLFSPEPGHHEVHS